MTVDLGKVFRSTVRALPHVYALVALLLLAALVANANAFYDSYTQIAVHQAKALDVIALQLKGT